MKNIILILFLLVLNSCGYTSVYKNQKFQDFEINIIEMIGDNQINNLIKNELKVYSNKSSNNKYDISINSNFQKIIISKNSAGVATDYKLLVNTKISINLNNEDNVFSFDESINIKSNSNSFEQNNYERNIKKNFASSIRGKFINELSNLNDN
jgi:outer membrane lipopolysaccharide assembly protein LptE/RlpB